MALFEDNIDAIIKHKDGLKFFEQEKLINRWYNSCFGFTVQKTMR